MHKIALVLAIAAVGEGLLALHLVSQLHQERASAQALQARVTELERHKPQAAGATFVAVPTQTAASSISIQRSGPAQAQVAPVLAAASPHGQDLREQMNAAMERQRTLLKDPEYREALQTQQKMMLMQSNPDVGRDLNLTVEQVDQLFDTLAAQSLRSMDTVSMPDHPNTSPEELQRKALEQQRASEAELKAVLGEAKYREWMDYQNTAGVRYEASRLRSLLANAGLPLEQSLAKPLVKALAEHQKAEQQRIGQALGQGAGTPVGFVIDDARTAVGLLPSSEDQLEAMQQRQRERLARVLTPEQMKVLEDDETAQLQLLRVQTKVMRAQQGAVGGDAAQSDSLYFAPNALVEPATED